MHDQERELKILLSPQQAQTLLEQSPFQAPRLQINTYYDTPDFRLRSQGAALRIRTIKPDSSSEKEQYILTIKKPLDAITKYEYERPVETDDLSLLKPEEKEWIAALLPDAAQLEPVTTFYTERSICVLPEAEYSIDHTVFKGHEDYEAEYEYRTDHDGVTAFNRLLAPAKAEWKQNGPSKSARAMMDQERENL